MNLFHKHGKNKTFYFHCLRHNTPRIARNTLCVIGWGLGIQTMQEFDHRNNKSNHVHFNETNKKVNCSK